MDLSKNRPMHVDELHEHITNSEYIKNKWDNGIAPKFPFYHGINTLGILYIRYNVKISNIMILYHVQLDNIFIFQVTQKKPIIETLIGTTITY